MLIVHVSFQIQIAQDSTKRRTNASKKLRAHLAENESVTGERRFYIELPEEGEHLYHITGEVKHLFRNAN